jgi:hypothetical protein
MLRPSRAMFAVMADECARRRVNADRKFVVNDGEFLPTKIERLASEDRNSTSVYDFIGAIVADTRPPARDYRPEKPTRTLASMSEFERAPRESMVFVVFVRVRTYSVLAGH